VYSYISGKRQEYLAQLKSGESAGPAPMEGVEPTSAATEMKEEPGAPAASPAVAAAVAPEGTSQAPTPPPLPIERLKEMLGASVSDNTFQQNIANLSEKDQLHNLDPIIRADDEFFVNVLTRLKRTVRRFSFAPHSAGWLTVGAA